MSMTLMTLEIAMKLVNPLNNRQHWRVVSRRGKEQKDRVGLYLGFHGAPKTPVLVTLTRVGKRKMDSDGLAASCKHVRDSIASWLGVDDGDETRVLWKYAQEIGKDYACRIEITAGCDLGFDNVPDPLQRPAATPAATTRAEPCSANPTKKSRPVKKSIWGSRA